MNNHNLSPTGAVIYWSAGPTSRQLLETRLGQLGLEEFTPPQRTDAAALKSVLLDYCDGSKSQKTDKVVQSHKKPKRNGFEVVDVERQEQANEYSHDFSALVHEGLVVITRGDADQRVLQQAFNEHKALLTGAAIGQMLVEVLAHLGGTALRPSGGVYWIPEDAVPAWQGIAAAVEESSDGLKGNKVYMLRTVMDETAMRAIRDAIISEVTTEAAVLGNEIAAGNLREAGLAKRMELAKSLHGRIARYEGILGEALDVLHQIVQVAEQAAASTVAVQESETAFAGVFG